MAVNLGLTTFLSHRKKYGKSVLSSLARLLMRFIKLTSSRAVRSKYGTLLS